MQRDIAYSALSAQHSVLSIIKLAAPPVVAALALYFVPSLAGQDAIDEQEQALRSAVERVAPGPRSARPAVTIDRL